MVYGILTEESGIHNHIEHQETIIIYSIITTTDAKMERDVEGVVPYRTYHDKIPSLCMLVLWEYDILDTL